MKHIEILGPSSSSPCKSLSFISFDSNSPLARCESGAFSYSSLQSSDIPRSVQLIDGSAFIGVSLDYFLIDVVHDWPVLEKQRLVDIIVHRLIWHFSISLPREVMNLAECVP
jgi:hypothetical protein